MNARTRNSAILVAGAILLLGVAWGTRVIRPRPRPAAGGDRGDRAALDTGPTPGPAVRPREAPSVPAERPEPVAALPRPEPRPAGFVGSQACTSCHAAIAEQFAAHPMGRSMDTMPPERRVEADGPATFHDREREYSVESREGVVFHRERVLGPDGEPVYDQAMPVRFAVGSGTRGRSYLVDHDGFLFQSPVGWFTASGSYGLSPGYEDDRTLRFERSIGDGCLHCHAGLVEHPEGRTDLYTERVFAEASIGCERCHGPGAEHVAVMSAAAPGTAVADMKIVDPGALEPSKREAVCNQCHLAGEAMIPRFGRGFADFRPGDWLDDTLLVFVHDEKSRASSGEKPVTQTEQMRQSGCFEGTGGTMGCISCHDPHSKPAPADADAFYRAKCNACHAEKPCTLPLAEQEAAPARGSCTACHMPSQALREVAHTAMTDHRVPRRPGEAAGRSRASTSADLVAFDDAASRVPPRELERARGLALFAQADVARSTRGAVEATRALVPRGVDTADIPAVVAALAGDVEALRGLGQLYARTGRTDAAAACWEAAVAAAPHDGEALSLLAVQFQRSGRLREALETLDRIVASNPWVAAIHAQRGALLVALGRPDEAATAVRRSLELDPSSLPVRSFLAELLERTGHTDESAAERRTISRLKAAAASPYRAPATHSADVPASAAHPADVPASAADPADVPASADPADVPASAAD